MIPIGCPGPAGLDNRDDGGMIPTKWRQKGRVGKGVSGSAVMDQRTCTAKLMER